MMACFTRLWTTEVIARISSDLGKFDIRTAACTCESDRAIVQGHVETYMKLLDQVPPASSQEEVLEAFNNLVRQRLPGVVKASLGRQGLRYRHLLLNPAVFMPFDTLAHGLLT